MSVNTHPVAGRGIPAKEGPFSTRLTDPAPDRKMTIILVVEDCDEIRDLAATMLKWHGYTTLLADCPQTALDIYQQNPKGIDLLLTDIIMPGTNGLSLARQLRQQRPDLKVVFMTGYTAALHGPKATCPLPRWLLGKPFTRTQLIDMIEGCLASDPSSCEWDSSINDLFENTRRMLKTNRFLG